jgi:two-component system sensor histidine kinase RegB
MALVAKEMSRELPADSPYSEDLKLLLSQSDRCRDILARLTLSPEDKSGAPFHRMSLTTLIELGARPHHREGVSVEVRVDPAHTPRRPGSTGGEAPDAAEQPMVPHSLEIVHGIENLIENAVDFADSRVSIAVGWSESEAYVEIADDGPGFSNDILGALGEPYVSTRRDSGGMGLGVFIAKTLLERTGAELAFGNRRDGGARIMITWPRPLLEAEASERASEAHNPSDRTEDDRQ